MVAKLEAESSINDELGEFASIRQDVDNLFAEVLDGVPGEEWESFFSEITDQQAKEIVDRCKWKIIHLPNLKSMTDKQTEILSQHEGGLWLWVESLTDKQTEILSQHEGGLWLWVKRLNNQQARYLSRHKWWYLWLMNLKSMTDEQAEFLIPNDYVNVAYIEKITDRQAELFVEQWNVFLANLESITDKQAEIFSGCRWDVDMYAAKLSSKQMKIMSKHKWKFLSFWSGQSLIDWAEYLSQYEWKLYLWFSRIESTRQLKLLLEHEWDLALNNLDSVTDEQLKLLLDLSNDWKHHYDIYLNGITDRQLWMALKSWFRLNSERELSNNKWVLKMFLTKEQVKRYNWCVENIL